MEMSKEERVRMGTNAMIDGVVKELTHGIIAHSPRTNHRGGLKPFRIVLRDVGERLHPKWVTHIELFDEITYESIGFDSGHYFDARAHESAEAAFTAALNDFLDRIKQYAHHFAASAL